MKKYKSEIISICLSIVFTFFVWHEFLVSGNSITFLSIFLMSFYLTNRNLKKTNRRMLIVTTIIASAFAVIEVICNSINKDYTLNHIANKWLAINFIGYATICFNIIVFIFDMLNTLSKQKENNELTVKNVKILGDNKISFAINVCLILCAWIPYLLTYYPGLLTADSCSQLEQALGLTPFTNHHPVFHTAIISILVNFGKGISGGNINFGVCCYIVFQMIMMAILFSYVLKFMASNRVHLCIRIMTLLYYMFYPVHALFSVIMWKDILFSAVIPVFIIKTYELITDPSNYFNKKGKSIAYIIVALLLAYLRNNGFYVLIITMIVLITSLKKYWKKIILTFGVIFTSIILINYLYYDILKIKKGSVGEMLSIPLQQIARVDKYYGETLNEEEKQEIDNIFKIDNIGEKYNPLLSDPVKAQLDTEYFSNNKISFIKVWLKLFIKHPKTYIESFIANSYGYYFPEATHWVANRFIEENNLGIYQDKIIQGNLVEKFNSLIEKRNIPLLSMFFSIGIAFWLIIICFFYEIYNKKYKKIIIYIPTIVLWLTLIASPVFCEYRYAYGMFTSIPVYIALCVINAKKKGEYNE